MAKTKIAQPDAWMALVLRTMSATELREEAAKETDALRRQWLLAELRKRGA